MRTLVVVLATLPLLAVRADPPASPTETTNPRSDDVAEQLPRVPPTSPERSLESIAVQRGFRVELVAAEPLVRDPVALDFDERGRLFVVQLPPYNAYAVEDFHERGSVALLEDSDGDGRYDRSTLYAADLNYPTAVACWDGGVFVGDAPDLLYLKDTDGDGKADRRRVVLTGFGRDKAGEAHLNSIRWGLDHRFHLSTSLSGGDVRPVAAKEAEAVSVRGRGIRFDPRDPATFERTSGGGQHGMSMDDWGRKFVCSNSVPAQTLMYDDRYLARNPRLEAPEPAVDITPDGKHTKLLRISPPEPWRVLRTRLRREGKVRGSDEGGSPFGFFTGATGVTIYRGDAWPETYRGNLLVGDVANNLVYRARLEPKGLGLVARRGDETAEFLASRDIWFRPVQFANAPDGTLYVLDMYRELIEGAAFLPPKFLQHLDAASGHDRGRIYRIAPVDFAARRRKPPRLDRATTGQLVALLEHRNGWHRETASRLLYERQDPSAVALLKRLATESKLPEGRVTALYALDGLQSLDEEILLESLEDATADVRVHALRLAEPFASDAPAIRARMAQLVGDPVLHVRYQLAFSLGSFHGPEAESALAELALRDAKNRWMQVAILSSLRRGADAVYRRLVASTPWRRTAHGQELLAALARQIGAGGNNGEIGVLLGSLEDLADEDQSLSEAVVVALVESQQGAAREQILAAAGGKAGEVLGRLLGEAALTAADGQAQAAARVAAIRSLRLARFAEVQPLIARLLETTQPLPVQGAALETAAAFDDLGVADLLLAVWPGLSPDLRARAAETLFSRPAWVEGFLDAVENKTVARSDVDPARIALLKQHPDPRIAARVGELFADGQATPRQTVVDLYQQALELEGDLERGKQVFKKNCTACHRLEAEGTAIGADLTAIRQRGLASILLNVLDPNREVKPKFLTYVVETVDGRVLTGMIASETANSLTLRRADGTSATVPRVDIEQLQSTGLSFMPEGLEKSIGLKDMADLLSYLNSIE